LRSCSSRPEAAIRNARAADKPLTIAQSCRGERRYFKQKLEPLIDGEPMRRSQANQSTHTI
jgi:hypothetical protein